MTTLLSIFLTAAPDADDPPGFRPADMDEVCSWLLDLLTLSLQSFCAVNLSI